MVKCLLTNELENIMSYCAGIFPSWGNTCVRLVSLAAGPLSLAAAL